jgi:hypothetical protein
MPVDEIHQQGIGGGESTDAEDIQRRFTLAMVVLILMARCAGGRGKLT